MMGDLIKTFVPIICLAISMTSCSSGDTEGAASAIQDRWTDFSEYWEAEDAAALAVFYAEDGMNVPPGMNKLVGREQIEAFYQGLFADHQSSTYNHETESVYTAGNLAMERGAFTVQWVRNDSTEWTFRARSMTVWEKTPEGFWEIRELLFNTPPSEE